MFNLSLIKKIELVRKSDCNKIDARLNSINYYSILLSGKSFTNIDGVKPESASCSDVEKSDDTGTYWEKKLTFTIPKITATKIQMFEYFKKGKVNAVITDANGNIWLLRYLNITTTNDLPGTVKGLNSIKATLSSLDKYPIISVII